MKIANKPIRWDHEPWTVCRTERANARPLFYAFNTRTGERKPVRFSYDMAFEDIPIKGAGQYAEPWGV